ncbi:MAG TPA: porin family protein [Vicinamibacterales bacterium]|nr:porin family protein [Vicinamibacterales bacterium]
MRRSVHVLAAASLVAMLVAPAAAQTRQAGPVPDQGMFAIGLSIGVAFPSDDFLETGWNLGAGGEYYFTPRISARGQLSGAWFDIFGHSFDGTVKPLAINGNIVYNWEHGKWHPYATGGFGLYHYRFDEDERDSSDTKAGLDLGGGIEYFFTRHDTLTGELLVHIVPGDADSDRGEYKTGYWTLMFGYKKYWR